MISPASASTPVTGGCAHQWISRSGTRFRRARAMARSRWTWPRPLGEEIHSAPPARPGVARHGPGAGLLAALGGVVVGVGGVRLGGDLGQEGPDVSWPVPPPVVPVLLRPPLGGVEHVIEREPGSFPGFGWRDRQCRRNG